jgi:hypothetical protein
MSRAIGRTFQRLFLAGSGDGGDGEVAERGVRGG